MSAIPKPVKRLIEELSRLPGVGPKTASRLTYFLLRSPAEQVVSLAEAIRQVKERTVRCSICFNIAETSPCSICSDPNREPTQICVVEEPLDVLALERTRQYHGLYHVLEGAISTAMYIAQQISPLGIRVTRLARGLPVGADLEYVDAVTLAQALEGRREV